MASAETPVAATQAPEGRPGLVDQLRANPRLPLLIVGAAVAITLLIALTFWTVGPTYGVLFSNLSDSDGGEIIAELEQMQVPYQFAANGRTILVPTDVIDQTRLRLAGEGLPKGGGVGFELMDNQSFGISQFAEHVNYKRALEGELARSIETIAAVSSARIHLAIPESSVFVREREKPTASVVLNLHRGRALGEGQVTAIVNLVASSVTNLPTEAVTVVDGSGNLLSAQPSGGDAQGLNETKLEYVKRIEDSYRESIEAILGPVVGRDNIRAQVVADVDFSGRERTEELYTPNATGQPAAIRSEQRSSTWSGGGPGIGGVPGALSNQPSPEIASPINNPVGEDGEGNGGANAQTQGEDANGSGVNNATINYEVNRTIRHVREQTGQIKRLSAAVVVDYPMQAVPVPPADGETEPTGETVMQAVPLSEERMAQITSLVREAIGYSAARGDSLEVLNMPFSNEPAGTVSQPNTPWWQNRELIAMVQTVGKYLLLLIAAWFVWRRMVKPLVDQAVALAQPRLAQAAVKNEELELSQDEIDLQSADAINRGLRRQQDVLLTTTRDTVKDDPRLAAAIIKSWMHSDA